MVKRNKTKYTRLFNLMERRPDLVAGNSAQVPSLLFSRRLWKGSRIRGRRKAHMFIDNLRTKSCVKFGEKSGKINYEHSPYFITDF